VLGRTPDAPVLTTERRMFRGHPTLRRSQRPSARSSAELPRATERRPAAGCLLLLLQKNVQVFISPVRDPTCRSSTAAVLPRSCD
jgi:hypothetical protein